jgi:aminoglycoside phosphotransferase (APT) family kinase protein
MADDGARLTAWLIANLPGIVPPVRLDPLPGGRSNLTSVVEDAGGRRWVLRRPPRAPVLATAHDVLREARIVAALATTTVPVAPVRATCADSAIDGAPFVVSDFVPGHVLRDSASARAASSVCRARAGTDLARALARLHRLRPEAVGLAELARPGDYVGRQVRRWTRQVEAGDGECRDLLVGLGARVAEAVPPQERVAVVHGDPKLDNCVLDDDGRLLALVDWELAAIGDPTADLALLLAYWAEPADPRAALQDPPSAVPGFAPRAELVEAYCEEVGWRPRHLEAYLAFSYWKLACIVAGVAHRALHPIGAATPDRGSARRSLTQVERLVGMAQDALEHRG